MRTEVSCFERTRHPSAACTFASDIQLKIDPVKTIFTSRLVPFTSIFAIVDADGAPTSRCGVGGGHHVSRANGGEFI